MSADFAERVVIVTGASRGIGAATAFGRLDAASYITGATLPIDGGKLAGVPPFGGRGEGG